MVKVRLEGLKIARARGKYYVYVRASGEALLKGFEGDRDDLRKRLAMPDMIGAYNARRKRDPKSYPDKTLGSLVAWFTDPDKCPEFADLAESTQGQYKVGLAWLEPEYDCPLANITQADLYEVRDRCASDKWPTFADKMMTALSSMFTKAVKRGKMPMNPAIGIDNARKSNKNANREWRPEEWTAAFAAAPLKIQIPMMIARYIGYRGQSIVKVQWSNYQPDPKYGKCFRATHKKNDEQHWVPAAPELQAFLDGLTRTSLHIATKHNGAPWKGVRQMQRAFSNWMSGFERRGLVGPDLTLHGLRVTFAAALARDGSNTKNTAAALGDRDERMGAHYTRHVENEARVIQAFGKPKKKKRTVLENGKA